MEFRTKFKKYVSQLSLNNYLFLVFLLLLSGASVLSIIGNIITKFPIHANIKWCIGIILSFFGMFLLKKNIFIEGYKTIIFLSVIFLVIIPAWFYGGGDNTITLLYMLLVAVVALLMFEKNYLKYVFAALSSISCFTLLIITFIFPDLIQPSTAEQNVFIDNLVQIFIIFSLACVLVDIFVRRYLKQNMLLKELNKSLELSASTDVLSGVHSRRKILELLNANIENESVYNSYIVMLDIDYFKQINDLYGHLTGDNIIRHFASHLENSVGNYGHIGRYGGDEFLIIFNSIDENTLLEIVNNIIAIPSFNNIDITASGGVMKKKTEHTVDLFIHEADELLFDAKKLGRNRIIIWTKKVILPKLTTI